MIPLQDGTKLEAPMKIMLVANHHRGSLFSKSPIEDEIASTDLLSNIPKVISKPDNSAIFSTTLPSRYTKMSGLMDSKLKIGFSLFITSPLNLNRRAWSKSIIAQLTPLMLNMGHQFPVCRLRKSTTSIKLSMHHNLLKQSMHHKGACSASIASPITSRTAIHEKTLNSGSSGIYITILFGFIIFDGPCSIF